jgi:hypothetical protein
LLGVDSGLIEDRQKGLRLEDCAGVNRHDDSPGSALVVEHDVASTPPDLTPTALAEGAQSFVAGDPRQSRHSFQTLTPYQRSVFWCGGEELNLHVLADTSS